MFGTRAILVSLSLLLAALSVLVAWHERRSASSGRIVWSVIAAATIIVTVAASILAVARNQAPGFTVQSEAESHYGWVRVVDDDRRGFRLLLSDASVISAVEITRNRTMLRYQELLGLLPTVHPEAAQALLIGLGGGYVARDLTAQGVRTDTIEIDPAVADAAKRFFHFEPTGLFLVGDARYEIKRLTHRYDLIIHDCFTGGAEPTHLLSQEMLSELRALLSERGILALNYVGFTQGEGTDAVASVHQTLKSLFPHLRTFVTDKTEFTDFIFLASREPVAIDPQTGDRRLRWLLDHEHRFTEEGGFVLTDDYNPLESRQVRKAETYRKHFLERIAFELLMR
jgi:spermidine synthase